MMPKSKTNGKKKNIGIVNLKIVAEKFQKSLSLGKKSACDDELELNDSRNVPDDVKEGHFAVIAVADYELKRFVVPLSYLTHPTFLRLLEQAAEEYGFNRGGAITIPCRPSELERILSDQQWMEGMNSRSVGVHWNSTKAMVTSC